MSKTKRPRLGRGLSALISIATHPEPGAHESTAKSQVYEAAAATSAGPESSGSDGSISQVMISTGSVEPNPYQPRRSISDESVAELAKSLAQDGVIQPIVVRPHMDGHMYQIVSGERRWRAAMAAGIEKIPAVIRRMDDKQAAEWALIENLQREDLNPIEKAEAFERLSEQFGISHDEIAKRVGSDRVTITNTLRLLDLCDEAKELVRIGKLSHGHGKVILGISDPDAQSAIARRAVAGGWSVRMLEARLRRAAEDGRGGDGEGAARAAHLADLEAQITSALQTKVTIQPGRKKGTGKLTLAFYTLDQFDALLAKLGVSLG